MRFFLPLFLVSACTCNPLPTPQRGHHEDLPDDKRILGGVVSNGKECGPIGRDILNAGGNAIDSGIGVLLCEGVTGPQSMGIGGGFLATVYIKEKSLITTINAREAAPKNVTATMFKGLKSIKGGHASAIPSEIKGYWELKQRYGNPNFKWEKIFEPTIKLCKEGYTVDRFLGIVLNQYEKEIRAEPTLSEIFINPETKQVYKEGETAFRPQLGETLRKIAENGAEEFYGGATGQAFIDDVRAMGGILTMEDLKDYQVQEKEPVSGLLDDDGLTLYTVPLPGSGVVLNEILQVLKGRVQDVSNATLIHRLAEAMKHAYGLRSKLADADFEPSARQAVIEARDYFNHEKLLKTIANDDDKTHNDPSYYGGVYEQNDHGTSNIAVIDRDGNGITATSTVNSVFGAFTRSPKTGIILNDEMDDFSTPGVTNAYGYPPSPINFIKPGKRPMSSMSPSIVIDKFANIQLLIGAAGGSQITTSVAQAIVRILLRHELIDYAINGLRIHHQLVPNVLMYEKDKISEADLEELRAKGHELQPKFIVNVPGFSAVTAIYVHSRLYPSGVRVQLVYPVYDDRRGGSSATTDGWSQ